MTGGAISRREDQAPFGGITFLVQRGIVRGKCRPRLGNNPERRRADRADRKQNHEDTARRHRFSRLFLPCKWPPRRSVPPLESPELVLCRSPFRNQRRGAGLSIRI